jgi:hypothetical protein
LGWIQKQGNRPTAENQRQNRRSAPRQHDEKNARLEYGAVAEDGDSREYDPGPLISTSGLRQLSLPDALEECHGDRSRDV